MVSVRLTSPVSHRRGYHTQKVCYVPPVGFEPTTCGLKVRSSDLTELKGLTRNNYITFLDVLQIAILCCQLSSV